jgi:hypothetical protein
MSQKMILDQVRSQILHRSALAVDVFDRSQQTKIAAGKLLTLDNQIDTTTGTVRFRGQFANTDLRLYPNQFVNARLLVKTLQNAVLVPTAAVQRNGTQAFVYIVSGNTVKIRNIEELTNENQVAAVTGSTLAKLYPLPASTSCRMAPQSRSRALQRRSKQPTVKLRAVSPGAAGESFTDLHSSTDRHDSPDGGDPHHWARCVYDTADLRLAEADYPTIQVLTFYPGASPQVMSSAVTAPLERQFGQVAGLTQMTSTSSDGSSVIVLQFSLDLNIDVAEQEVQAAINAAQGYLPTDLPVPPVYSKSNPADAPILTLALTSKTCRSQRSKTWSTHASRPRSRS